MSTPFSQLLRSDENEQRAGAVNGLVFAMVAAVTKEGYELDFLSGSLDERSAPARVATFMARDGYGAYFMPEVGDEVVVGFELGDINQPVILGSLWSDKAKPPTQADTKASNNVRTIVSRSKHEITFDDTPGKEKIVIKSKGGLEITLEDTPPGKISIKTTGTIATSRIVMDGVAWHHQHATGVGPSGPPVSVVPVL